MRKLIIKSVIFLLLFAIILIVGTDSIFKKKTNFHYSMELFNKSKKDSLDIMIMGSSHAEQSYIPFFLDSTLNVNSHNFGCGGQRLMVTNQILENILEEANPTLLILDVFWGSFDFPDSDEEKGLQLVGFDDMNFSTEKLMLAKNIYNLRELPSVMSPTIRNHSNWPEEFELLRRGDDNPPKELWSKGFAGVYKTINNKQRERVLSHKDKQKIFFNNPNEYVSGERTEFEFNELNRTLEICKKNNVKLLVVSAPDFTVFDYPVSKNFYISLKRYCDSLDVDYLSYHTNFNKIGFKANDFRDLSHLNIYGADKTTSFLIKYLVENKYFETQDLQKVDQTLERMRKQFIEKPRKQPVNPMLKFQDVNQWKLVNASLIETNRVYENNNVFKVSRKSASSSSYIATNNVNINNGNYYRISILAQKGNIDDLLGFRLAGIYPNRIDAVFDLNTGVVEGTYKGGDFDIHKASISEKKDGWYECTIIGKVNSDKIQVLLGSTDHSRETRIWEAKIDAKPEIHIIPSSLKIKEIDY